AQAPDARSTASSDSDAAASAAAVPDDAAPAASPAAAAPAGSGGTGEAPERDSGESPTTASASAGPATADEAAATDAAPVPAEETPPAAPGTPPTEAADSRASTPTPTAPPTPPSVDDSAPLEPVAPTPPTTPVGPIELAHVRDAWPEVLGQLEVASRSSWLVVSTSTVAAFDADVLTLAFRTTADLTAFKTRTPEGGPSEDLRQAIQTVLGIRVKYLARLEGDGNPGGPGGSSPRPAGPSSDGPGAVRAAAPQAAGARPASASAPYASSVTEWAVAPIPSSDGGAPTTTLAPPAAPSALAVDDEPDEAAVEPGASSPRAGVVLPSREVAASVPAPDEVDDDDVIPPADEVEAPLPPVVLPRMAPLRGGVQRYGEAVVRQMLGATFVRDEPYEPPTRFS
ncbi:MAG: DNA polymerase III subunit gamma and tau, partial [Microbacterium sp.]